MSNEKVQELLQQLHEELSSTQLDNDTQRMLANFADEAESTLGDTSDQGTESLVETAKLLETHFAIEHPLAERCMREIIDVLGKMGI